MNFKAIAAVAFLTATITSGGLSFAAQPQAGTAASRSGVTVLSRKVDAIGTGWTRGQSLARSVRLEHHCAGKAEG